MDKNLDDNIFDILKISRTEIRHSNMLAWFMTPSESHGFHDRFLIGFLNMIGLDATYAVKDIEIYREHNSIDILFFSRSREYVVAIENKIDTGEHDDQLTRYYNTVNYLFPSFEKHFIYLTVHGEKASDAANWRSISHKQIYNLLSMLYESSNNLTARSQLLIADYLRIVKRICDGLPASNPSTNNGPSEKQSAYSAELKAAIYSWLDHMVSSGAISYSIEHTTVRLFRYTTPRLSELLSRHDSNEGGWNNGHFYFYEITINKGGDFWITQTFTGKDMPESYQRIVHALSNGKAFGKSAEKWLIAYTTRKANVFSMQSDQEISAALDNMYEEIMRIEDAGIARVSRYN